MKLRQNSSTSTKSFAWRIHRPRLNQLAAVTDLLARQLGEHGVVDAKKNIGKTLAKISRRKSLGFVLITTGPQGIIVGVALGCAFQGLEHKGASGWLEEFYVLPEFRNQGLGALMLDKFIQTARKAGWRAIDLEVAANHRRAIQLYRRNGFACLKRRRLSLPLKHTDQL
jgi:ribosomal protein S18 acetylase RimI-like enzyme